MYRLIALDLDGTLLNDELSITEKTREVIGRARDCGAKIVLVSGRAYKSIERYINELNINDIVITMNGAKVTSSDGEKVIFGESLDEGICKTVLSMCEKEGVTAVMFAKDCVNIEKPGELTDFFEKHDRIPVTYTHTPLSKCCDGVEVGKLLLIDENEKLQKIKSCAEREIQEDVNLHFSLPFFLEVYSPNVDKAIMLGKVAEYYGIAREEILAIGDGGNDIPMLKFAGCSVAMGNAPDEVKKVADYVTVTNEEDGAALAIEKFLF